MWAPLFYSGVASFLFLSSILAQNDQSISGSSAGDSGSSVSVSASSGGSASSSGGSGDFSSQNYQDQDGQYLFPASPYAAQYPGHSVQDMLGQMASQPWNGGPPMMTGLQSPSMYYGQPNNRDGGMMANSDPGHFGGPMMGMMGFPDAPVTRALAVLNTPSNSGVNGVIVFTRIPYGGLNITGNVTGLAPNTNHGFHIHQVRLG